MLIVTTLERYDCLERWYDIDYHINTSEIATVKATEKVMYFFSFLQSTVSCFFFSSQTMIFDLSCICITSFLRTKIIDKHMVVIFQIMAPKARIDEHSFQKAIRAIPLEELNLLDSSSTTGAVWSHMCLLMGKPDNTENRRACYDIWKRKRFGSHDIVDEIRRKGISQCVIDRSDPSSVSSRDKKDVNNEHSKSNGERNSETSRDDHGTGDNTPVNLSRRSVINVAFSSLSL